LDLKVFFFFRCGIANGGATLNLKHSICPLFSL
jgi:hypothetical protein